MCVCGDAETEGEEAEAVVRGAREAEGGVDVDGIHVAAAGGVSRQDHKHVHASEVGEVHAALPT